MSTSGASSGCNGPRILRCFCNCSELTRDEIESMATRKLDSVLASDRGRNMLRAFFSMGRRTTSVSMQRLECYELCERLIADAPTSGFPNDDDLDDLRERCPSFQWEQRLDHALDGGTNAFAHFCEELKYQAERDLEQHADFQRFRVALREKLKQ